MVDYGISTITHEDTELKAHDNGDDRKALSPLPISSGLSPH